MPAWAAMLTLAVALPVALLARLWPFERAVDRTPEAVAAILRDFLEGTGGPNDWDDFESVPITDPKLEDIRRRAAQAGPSETDHDVLVALLSEVEAMARARTEG
ncbi:hypothetical protein CFHF_11870 [Caulobacter flavus]|uniref:Uncharacterized protein n=2 Tax=Caulobacter flavus TaxID=1679497 RepID=A0A2N5CTZ8_9CAUL|nr:hypothetical protein [Caulobacter flavus]AYV45768.1 hypothetical protein C1707_05610 [Caulobacter flavus]PLR15789.1 hypothetical protein CFHF_11870 [Caulobacter flavus]